MSAKIEVYKQFQSAQEKYIYFLLTAAASAIVFSLQKIDGRVYEWRLLFLGIAISCWGLSFYCGCRQVTFKLLTLYTNIESEDLIEKNPVDPKRLGYPINEEHIEKRKRDLKVEMERTSNLSSKFHNLQFTFMITGIIAYVVWHLIEMYLRTIQVK